MDMEVEKVYALEKTGMDGYYLRTLYLPGETVQEIRQQEPAAYKDLHGLFDGVPYADVDGVMNTTSAPTPVSGTWMFLRPCRRSWSIIPVSFRPILPMTGRCFWKPPGTGMHPGNFSG